jgi:hypothetical protein
MMEADPQTVADVAWKAMKQGRDVRAITAMLDRCDLLLARQACNRSPNRLRSRSPCTRVVRENWAKDQAH